MFRQNYFPRFFVFLLASLFLLFIFESCKEKEQAVQPTSEVTQDAKDLVWMACDVPASGRESQNASPNPLRISFNEAVVTKSEVGSSVHHGIKISPELRGEWRWEGERELVFYPLSDWSIWTTYRIDLRPEIFTKAIKLRQNRCEFKPRKPAKTVFGATPSVFRVWSGVTAPAPKELIKDALPEPVVITFSAPVVSIGSIDKALDQGISMQPALEGEWSFSSQKELRFVPKNDWPISTAYTVVLDKSLFEKNVELEKYKIEFSSPAFEASIPVKDFHVDPEKPVDKRVTATARFSYPVNKSDFEKRVSMKLIAKGESILGDGLKEKDYGFKITYDELAREAYITSEPLSLPEKEAEMRIEIASGVAAMSGGVTKNSVTAAVTVPGVSNYFRIADIKSTYVENKKKDLDQVLVIESTAAVRLQDLEKAIKVYELPKKELEKADNQEEDLDSENDEDAPLPTPEMITQSVLKSAKPVVLTAIPTERDFATILSFRHNLSPGAVLVVLIEKGMSSVEGFKLPAEIKKVLSVSALPKQVRFQSQGSLLALSGEKKLSFMTRSVKEVSIEISRLLPSTIAPLITQTEGKFQKPNFQYYNFSPDNIGERFSEKRVMPDLPHGQAAYAALDLTSFLAARNLAPKGLFLVSIADASEAESSPWSFEDSDDDAGEEGQMPLQSSFDKRLILATDIGFLVKDLQAGGHEVYVQSLSSGNPIEGALVQVIGKNGLSIITKKSDRDGRAIIPKFSDFKREKEAIAYVVEKEGDLAFLPLDRYDRRLNLSRFDIGGVHTQSDAPGLQAYMFSDRGIYRPGEEMRFGLILKPEDWKQDIADIPFELVLNNPRQVEVHKEKIKFSQIGFEEFRFTTLESMPTGQYTLGLYVVKDKKRGSLLGSTSVRVEEFLPDRMTITTHLSKEVEKGWISPEKLKGLVSLRNFFGTPAVNRRVTGLLHLAPNYPGFSAYKDYFFYDPKRAKSPVDEKLDEQRTNEQGEVSFDLDLTRFSTATYKLSFLAQGFEAEGGRSVSAVSTALVSPMDYLIGYKAEGDLSFIRKDQKRSLNIIAIDPKLEKTSVEKLSFELVEKRYVSILTKQKNDTYAYQSQLKEIPVQAETVSVPAEGLRYVLHTDQVGDFSLVIYGPDRLELNRVNYSVVGTEDVAVKLDMNAELGIKINKTDFLPGEEIEMQVTAPYTGAGLITIEKDKVYAYKWFKTTTNSFVERITVPQTLEGNAYVNVSFVRSLSSPEIFVSPLSVGVVPFSVSRKTRSNDISLKLPELLKPGEDLPITYRAAKAGKAIVYLVDEGILQVARYKTPDPLSHFFRKKALEVKTSQILDLLLPEYSILKALSGVGGDEDAISKHLNPFKRKKLAPVVWWSGFVDIGQEERTLYYTVPDYFNGSIKAFVVAVSSDAIGVAEAKTYVRGDIILSPNAPTFVAPGDEFELSVGVSNNIANSGSNTAINIAVSTDDALELIGDKSKSVLVKELGEDSVSFRVKARSKLGAANIRLQAAAGEKQARASVDLSVRPASALRTSVQSGYVKSGSKEITLTRQVYPESRKSEAIISSGVLGLLKGLVEYLNTYPYTCTEQLLSKAIPSLVLLAYPEFGIGTDKAKDTLSSVMKMLGSRQNSNGGISYWSGFDQASAYLTAYAAEFFMEAKDRGLPVQGQVLNRALTFLREIAARTPENDEALYENAYAIYILTRSGVLTTNYISTLREYLAEREKSGDFSWKTNLTALYIAASYKMLKLDAEAEELIKGFTVKPLSSSSSYWYYDSLSSNALYLLIVSNYFPERAKAISQEEIIRFVEPLLQENYNSYSSALTILAVEAYSKQLGAAAAACQASELRSDGAKVDFPPSSGSIGVFPLSEIASGVRFNSSKPYYYQVIESGYDLDQAQQPQSSGIEISREYRDENGKAVTQSSLGAKLKVILRVRSTDGLKRSNINIVDLLPGGFEVDINDPALRPGNTNAAAFAQAANHNITQLRPDFVDIREDKLMIFADVDGSPSEFAYHINSTNRGHYSLPAPYAESMYDRSVQACGAGGRIEVK